ncbi:macrolide ABC transporter ATP-binding protein [Candidatus Falkowbacteria bacterium CG10_big_fil_rev_8_21_14_0_10_37_6]|uniref:Macrolide ABC transporter ATP-binding protein n=1 Tax=Candidatus Falkowbacteria bacterium CG10_big_fil_rev_8_21_14_0_10_37_6 TaxID=1974563 RepID=A0A2H0V6J3_9BACT|nr:MAG: macrolide ABC transporter ATP-binding protein [Candidatus Falkowbacteria bacterium CG10_big_fil_rev_8_21_14_0_10_37_6]
MPKKPLIKLKNLHKEFDTEGVITKVLHDITFDVLEGSFVAIMGPSGSGKSTLMHILGFLDRPTTGVFLFKDEDTSKFNDKKLADLRNSEIGFVFQQFNLLPRTTVLDNVKLPLTYTKKMSATQKEEAARKAVEAVGLNHRINNLSNQLSGGEKQRVAIARALVNEPSIIFADEPTGNLDSKTGGQIMEILEKLNDSGKTIILVTHEKYTAEYSERIIFLKDGNIENDGKVEHRRRNGLIK